MQFPPSRLLSHAGTIPYDDINTVVRIGFSRVRIRARARVRKVARVRVMARVREGSS